MAFPVEGMLVQRLRIQRRRISRKLQGGGVGNFPWKGVASPTEHFPFLRSQTTFSGPGPVRTGRRKASCSEGPAFNRACANASHAFPPVNFTATLCNKYYHYLHFRGEGMEARRVKQLSNETQLAREG